MRARRRFRSACTLAQNIDNFLWTHVNPFYGIKMGFKGVIHIGVFSWWSQTVVTVLLKILVNNIWASPTENIPSNVWAKWRFRSANTFAQSDQNLSWSHFGYPGMQNFFMRTRKTLIRLRECAGWSVFVDSMCQEVRFLKLSLPHM